MRKIDFETHFGTPEWVDALRNNPGFPRLEASPEGSLRLCYRDQARVGARP